jgi:hypothetical protein
MPCYLITKELNAVDYYQKKKHPNHWGLNFTRNNYSLDNYEISIKDASTPQSICYTKSKMRCHTKTGTLFITGGGATIIF